MADRNVTAGRRRPGGREVAVTGIGLQTPGGDCPAAFWATLCSGESTAAALPVIGNRDLPVRFGCRIPDFDPVTTLGDKAVRRMDRVSQLAVVSGAAAIADSGLTDVAEARAGIVVGTAIGGVETLEGAIAGELRASPEFARRNALAIPAIMANAATAQLAIYSGWAGPNITVVNACASGANAIGEGMKMVRDGVADIVLAGGVEAPLTAFGILGFHHLRVLSTRNGDPRRASRPFDVHRDGFVLAEAAAFVVLEPAADARARGARSWAYLRGYCCNNDAWDVVMPRSDGRGAENCMRIALEDAQADLSDVLFINAHGTSTLINDRVEAHAIRGLFGSSTPPVTSNKGALGHSLGAAGAVEFVATCLSLGAGHIPPTANYELSESQIDIDVVSGKGASCDSRNRVAISNSFAFGGGNACLVVQGGERSLTSGGKVYHERYSRS